MWINFCPRPAHAHAQPHQATQRAGLVGCALRSVSSGRSSGPGNGPLLADLRPSCNWALSCRLPPDRYPLAPRVRPRSTTVHSPSQRSSRAMENQPRGHATVLFRAGAPHRARQHGRRARDQRVPHRAVDRPGRSPRAARQSLPTASSLRRCPAPGYRFRPPRASPAHARIRLRRARAVRAGTAAPQLELFVDGAQLRFALASRARASSTRPCCGRASRRAGEHHACGATIADGAMDGERLVEVEARRVELAVLVSRAPSQPRTTPSCRRLLVSRAIASAAKKLLRAASRSPARLVEQGYVGQYLAFFDPLSGVAMIASAASDCSRPIPRRPCPSTGCLGCRARGLPGGDLPARG